MLVMFSTLDFIFFFYHLIYESWNLANVKTCINIFLTGMIDACWFCSGHDLFRVDALEVTFDYLMVLVNYFFEGLYG